MQFGTARMVATIHAVATPATEASTSTIAIAATHGSTPRDPEREARRLPPTPGGGTRAEYSSRSEGTAAD